MPSQFGPTFVYQNNPVGAPAVYSKAFQFNTANLSNGTGLVVYTPAVGDLLMDAWVEVDTAWDGTTPKADIGTGVTEATGLWLAGGFSVDMTSVDTESFGDGILLGEFNSGSLVGISVTSRSAPAKFTASNPLKIWVTQNGLLNGASPGSTAGAAIVYFVIARAVAA